LHAQVIDLRILLFRDVFPFNVTAGTGSAAKI